MFPDWMLERFEAGDLDPAEARRLEAALATQPELQARLEALRADSRAILAAHPPEQVARVVARRLAAQAPPPRPAWRLALVPALAVAAALVVAWAFAGGAGGAPGGPDELRLKGDGPSLALFRLGDAGPERLGDGAPVHPHDVVQVAFELAGLRWLVVVSVDGGGNATLHYPLPADPPAGPQLKVLPRSFELDDAPGYERFFLVASDRPLAAGEVLAAARALAQQPGARTAALEVPPGAVQRSVRLDKVPR